MLKRDKIYNKVEADKDVKKIFIFCEGEKREVEYFTYFRGFSSNIDIIPIPNFNGQSDPVKLLQNAVLKIEGNELERPKFNFKEELGDEVWFVIDTDRWHEGNKIETLRTYCQKKANWFVNQSNPSFEIWLYFHFHTEKPIIGEIEASASFKDFVNRKILGGFDSQKHPLLFQDAIANSEKNYVSDGKYPKYLSTELHVLAKSILPFIKEVIDECLKKD